MLWEAKIEDDFIYGYTENYIRVATHYDANLINKISNVLLEKLDKNIIIAKILNDENKSLVEYLLPHVLGLVEEVGEFIISERRNFDHNKVEEKLQVI